MSLLDRPAIGRDERLRDAFECVENHLPLRAVKGVCERIDCGPDLRRELGVIDSRIAASFDERPGDIFAFNVDVAVNARKVKSPAVISFCGGVWWLQSKSGCSFGVSVN